VLQIHCNCAHASKAAPTSALPAGLRQQREIEYTSEPQEAHDQVCSTVERGWLRRIGHSMHAISLHTASVTNRHGANALTSNNRCISKSSNMLSSRGCFGFTRPDLRTQHLVSAFTALPLTSPQSTPSTHLNPPLPLTSPQSTLPLTSPWTAERAHELQICVAHPG
jgi:hypothetical protein